MILILYILQLWVVDALDVLSIRIFFFQGVSGCVCKLAVEFHPPPVNVIGSTDVPGRWRQSWQNKIFFVNQSMWHHL